MDFGFGKVTAWANVVYVEEGKLKAKDFWKKRKETFDIPYINVKIIPISNINIFSLFGIILYFKSIRKLFTSIGVNIKNFSKSKLFKKVFGIPIEYRIPM